VLSSYLKQYSQNDRNKRKLDADGADGASVDGTNVTSATAEAMDVDTSMNANNTSDRATPSNKNDSGSNNQERDDTKHIVKKEAFNVRNHEGYELLSKKELDLCQNIELAPKLYIEAKKVIVQEALMRDMLDHEGSGRRTTHKIDIEKRGDVYDFCLQAGFIPSLPDPNYHA